MFILFCEKIWMTGETDRNYGTTWNFLMFLFISGQTILFKSFFCYSFKILFIFLASCLSVYCEKKIKWESCVAPDNTFFCGGYNMKLFLLSIKRTPPLPVNNFSFVLLGGNCFIKCKIGQRLIQISNLWPSRVSDASCLTNDIKKYALRSFVLSLVMLFNCKMKLRNYFLSLWTGASLTLLIFCLFIFKQICFSFLQITEVFIFTWSLVESLLLSWLFLFIYFFFVKPREIETRVKDEFKRFDFELLSTLFSLNSSWWISSGFP